ncbi:MAG: Gldg family protein [Proteobacteria bacterium]|nr:Gldg family protein [Pseudomonadota bacterium]
MKWLESIEKSKLGAAGLALAVVLFFAVNIFSNAAFQASRLDLTEGKLFTLSQGTLKVLADIDEPIAIRLFYTKLLGERSPRHATYFERVRELLERYADLSQGKVILEVIKPEPFSDSEDRAVAAGLQGIPLNDSGDLGYFGLAGANSTDDRASIPFFTTERETFLEYDLTRIVHTLANPERTVVGLMSPLPLNGGSTRPPFNAGPRWAVLDQISEFFEVHPLPMEMRQIPENIDILMLVHPKGLSDFTRYAIDQFVLGGGRALIFVDANAEVDAPADGRMRSLPRSEFNKNLNAWGLNLVDNKVAGDLALGRDDFDRWHKILHAKGWVAPGWPEEYGGTGWSPVERYIFDEECAVAGAPRVMPFGVGMVGPVIYTFGSAEQKADYLPRILSNEHWWCQGYSEPGAGSDLASLRTRAVRDGDHYVVNGQKTWTTAAQWADHIFCLVRTDTEAKPQEGISFLLIDMDDPGVIVRPIITIDGGHPCDSQPTSPSKPRRRL